MEKLIHRRGKDTGCEKCAFLPASGYIRLTLNLICEFTRLCEQKPRGQGCGFCSAKSQSRTCCSSFMLLAWNSLVLKHMLGFLCSGFFLATLVPLLDRQNKNNSWMSMSVQLDYSLQKHQSNHAAQHLQIIVHIKAIVSTGKFPNLESGVYKCSYSALHSFLISSLYMCMALERGLTKGRHIRQITLAVSKSSNPGYFKNSEILTLGFRPLNVMFKEDITLSRPYFFERPNKGSKLTQ